MRQPTLFLTVGLPRTGKTTAARRIEIELRALRLTKDEWVSSTVNFGSCESTDVPCNLHIQIPFFADRRSSLLMATS